MKERPINLRQHEVVAIRAGRQTQLRRVIKPVQPRADGMWPAGRDPVPDCPYGQPGDRLYGREPWRIYYDDDADLHHIEYRDGTRLLTPDCDVIERLIARTDWSEPDDYDVHATRWYSPIMMPRRASRITLDIACVRVERVQDISEADAIAEGIDTESDVYAEGESMQSAGSPVSPERYAFATLWRGMHGDASWDANPFVWVIEFRRLPQP